MTKMPTEERTSSYGHSKIVAKKVIEIEGRFVEVRLMEVEYQNGKRIIARCRWANRDQEAMRIAYDKGYDDAKKEFQKGDTNED